MPETDAMPFSNNMIRAIFNSLSAHIAIIDDQGMILETNAAWQNFSAVNGHPGQAGFSGVNYLAICDSARDQGAEDAKAVALGIREVIQGQRTEFLYDYPCHSPSGERWFYMRAVPMTGAAPLRIIVSHEDVTDLKLAQESLKAHQEILEERNQSLEEANIALKVLLGQRDADRAEMEQRFLAHIKTFVLPYIQKLKTSNLGEKNRTLISIVEDQLREVSTPLMQQMTNARVMLTPQEMQVASLVRDGRTTAEIADVLYISDATVSFHRKNLRKKLGLRDRRANLRSFLLSMS